MKTVKLPNKLTAANGAKAHLIGKFYEQAVLQCPECLGSGDGDDCGNCEICDGAGEVMQDVPVSWYTIKDIYRRVVEYFEPKMDFKDSPLRVNNENGELVIRVGILRLDGHKYHNEIPALSFTDREEWIKDVISEITKEEENGQNPLNLMLDNAMKAALENGSMGIDIDKPTFIGRCPVCENDLIPLRHTKNGIRCADCT